MNDHSLKAAALNNKEGGRYLLALCGIAGGAWRRVHGFVEVRGGKVAELDVSDMGRPVWLALLKSVLVKLEADEIAEQSRRQILMPVEQPTSESQ